jgi:hypothetical protein
MADARSYLPVDRDSVRAVAIACDQPGILSDRSDSRAHVTRTGLTREAIAR